MRGVRRHEHLGRQGNIEHVELRACTNA
jgi:hypothetical protein